jgi:hypothetical protein
MSDFQMYGFDTVTLVDRTGLGSTEIVFDGQRIVFKPGQTERVVPAFLAEWLSRVDQHRVHTTDGGWEHRFGFKNEDGEVTDCSPIQIDKSKLEGWNVDAYAIDRDPEKVQYRELRRNPADFQNDAAASGGSFSKQR